MSIVKQGVSLVAAVLFLSTFVSGCADRVAERSGTQVDIVPVVYSLSLKIKPKQHKSAAKEQQLFLLEHKNLVLTQNIELIWNTKIGKYWAYKTKEQLLNDGVNTKNITVMQGKAGFNQRFDYQINITAHHVLLAVCPYFKSRHYSAGTDGCYSDSARWQSMVNPQKMLQQPLKTEHANK